MSHNLEEWPDPYIKTYTTEGLVNNLYCEQKKCEFRELFWMRGCGREKEETGASI